MVDEKIKLVDIQFLLKNFYIKLPSFQRAYTWGKKEINQFLKDLECCSIEKEYFIGNIFCYSQDNEKIFIIDGQQRITTLFLLLNGIRLIDNKLFNTLNISFFEDNKAKFDTEEASPFCHYLFDSDNMDEIYKILIEESNKDFTKINMYFCQKYICEYLKTNQIIKKFILKIMGNLKMILIFCKNISEGYKIFENINSKGQPLNNVDLIKTAFFSRIKDKRGEKEFDSFKYNIWKEIEEKFYIRLDVDDTASKINKKNNKSISNFHQIFSYYNQLEFGKKHSRNSRILYMDYVLKLDSMSQLQLKKELNNILDLAKTYNYIVNPFDRSIPTLESIQRCIIFLDNLKIKIYIPFAIALINKIENGNYRNYKNETKKLFCKIAVFHFIFNTVFDEKPSLVENKYNSLAHSIYAENLQFKKINNKINEITFSTINNQIGTELETNFEKYKIKLYKVLFTIERAGEKLQKRKEFKKSKDALQINFLLGIFEQFLKNDYSNIPVIDTVEHINCLKDTGKDNSYNFCIFNFLPLETKLNDECGDKDLSQKIKIYKKSNYMLTKLFCKTYEECEEKQNDFIKCWEKQIVDILISMLSI